MKNLPEGLPQNENKKSLSYFSAYTYNQNGAVTSTTDSSGTITYNYNSFGNLTSFTQQDGAQWQILRDYNGNRVGVNFFETPESITIRDNQNRALATLTANGSIESSYVYGIKSNAPDYMVLNGVIYKLISDQIGSMRLAVSTTDGSILERIDYDEFGNVLNDTNRGAQNFGFAGSYSPQPGAGFLRIVFLGFNERHYDPLTGRWNRQDPIGFAGGDSNLYGYVLADPINHIDPTGLFTVCATIGGVGVCINGNDPLNPSYGQFPPGQCFFGLCYFPDDNPPIHPPTTQPPPVQPPIANNPFTPPTQPQPSCSSTNASMGL